jgi:hypothetical protein
MPLLDSPLFDALDVQDAMIAKLQADPYIQSFLINSATPTPAVNTIEDDDSTPGSVSAATNTRLVFTLAQDGWADATLGREMGGMVDITNTYAVMLYFSEGGGPNRLSGVKRKLVKATQQLKMALMRYSQGTGVPAGGSQSVELWWTVEFANSGKGTSIYMTPQGCRLSITMVNIKSRMQFN